LLHHASVRFGRWNGAGIAGGQQQQESGDAHDG
jgi:hypothetical protein